jgi:hypothetical protein
MELIEPAGNLSDSLSVGIRGSNGRFIVFTFRSWLSAIPATTLFSACIFDPHAAKYPGKAQIDNQSLLHIATAF